MGYPVFASGDVLNASDMNAVGLWRVASVSFSGATINVNNCFTSDYDNYRIVIRALGSGALTTMFMQMRLSGTPANTNYYQGGLFGTAVGGSGALNVNNGTAWFINNTISTSPSNTVMDIYSPALAEQTNYTAQSSEAGNAMWTIAGNHRTATAYDGFTLTVSGTTITGSLQVYGYRKP